MPLFRIFLYIINVLLLLFALSLIAVVLVMGVIPGLIKPSLIAYGVIFVLIIIMVFFGVRRRIRLITIILIKILIVCAIFQIVVCITLFTIQSYLRDMYEKRLNSFYDLSAEGDASSKIIIDNIQQSTQCCGLNGRQDTFVRKNSDLLISSCCDKTVEVCTRSQAYKEGCGKKAVDYMLLMFKIIASLFCCFGVVEIGLVSILCCFPI